MNTDFTCFSFELSHVFVSSPLCVYEYPFPRHQVGARLLRRRVHSQLSSQLASQLFTAGSQLASQLFTAGSQLAKNPRIITEERMYNPNRHLLSQNKHPCFTTLSICKCSLQSLKSQDRQISDCIKLKQSHIHKVSLQKTEKTDHAERNFPQPPPETLK